MSLSGKTGGSADSLVKHAEEPEERTNRKRLWWIAIFVLTTVATCLLAYVTWRPANRHPDPTPYDDLIGQLRARMTEDDVLALFRSASAGNIRAEVKTYDEPSGGRHVITYQIGQDEPLKVRMGGPTGRTAAEWCYRDHCYDNIE